MSGLDFGARDGYAAAMGFVDKRGFEGVGCAPFALAVFGTALFTALAALILTLLDDGAAVDLPMAVMIAGFTFAAAAVVIAFAAALIGLPLTWFLARNRLEAPWIYPLAGLSAGGLIIVFLPVLAGELRGGAAFEFLRLAWIGALPGGVCGTIWWLAYRRHEQGPGA